MSAVVNALKPGLPKSLASERYEVATGDRKSALIDFAACAGEGESSARVQHRVRRTKGRTDALAGGAGEGIERDASKPSRNARDGDVDRKSVV